MLPDWVNRYSPLALARLSSYAKGYSLPMADLRCMAFFSLALAYVIMTGTIRHQRRCAEKT
jgi:hypothetical protein